MKRLLRRAIRSFGFDLIKKDSSPAGLALPSDLTSLDQDVLRKVAGYTMTSVERQATLIAAVRYCVRRGIAGSMVECGVWRGGSSMAIALALRQEGAKDRDLYLFDTFTGMTAPTDVDATADGILASTHLVRDVEKTGYWCVAGIEDVKNNMASTGYPDDLIHYIAGPVEATIPTNVSSGPIALLRLDTDWYESTRHELVHLFPRLASGGVLIVDDYGHWAGARKALDEYLQELPVAYYLHRIDYTGRMLIKL